MIKRAPSPGQLTAMIVFALSCFSLMLFLWVSFGGPVPLKPQGYRVNVSFDEAVQLATEADVRISGVTVGKVKKVEPSNGPHRRRAGDRRALRAAAQRRQGDAAQQDAARRDIRGADARHQGRRRRFPRTAAISGRQVSPQVELDEVIRTFDPETREGVRRLAGRAVGRDEGPRRRPQPGVRRAADVLR